MRKQPFLRRGLIVLLVAVAAAVSPAQACGVDDGFVGPCCGPPSPSFPLFPTITLPGLGASFNDCNLDCQWHTNVTVIPTQVLCDYWVFGLSIVGTGFGDPSVPVGFLAAKYARTWQEFTPVGNLQVWRWLVNGDLVYAPPATPIPPSLCQVPFSASFPHFLPVHYMGHVDFAFNCTTSTWEVALALTHLCPYESHAPWSARPLPLSAIPTADARTYHFVAPDNFTFGPGPGPDGPIVADAMRQSTLSFSAPYACISEDPVIQGVVAPAFDGCACEFVSPAGGNPSLYHHQTMTYTSTNCGLLSLGNSIAVPGVLPAGFRELVIGSWSVGLPTRLYPGPSTVGLYNGILFAPPVCGGGNIFHAVMGVGVVGGWGMTLFNSPTPGLVHFESIDLANILILPTLTAGLGALFLSDRVWSINTL
jgi:hypothetical protein